MLSIMSMGGGADEGASELAPDAAEFLDWLSGRYLQHG
jgi:hypothetical protein